MKVINITAVILLLCVYPGIAGESRMTLAGREGGRAGLESEASSGKQYSYDDITVTRVIDGDTVQLENGERVRLLGIDTPELYSTRESREKARSKGINVDAARILGKQATVFTTQLMEGKRVRLVFDVEKRDKYDRLLAYVFIDRPPAIDAAAAEGYYFIYNGAMTSVFCNATIVKSGFAHPMTIPPNLLYSDVLRAVYREAREHKRGLWK